jgi:hypothetical protein
MCVALDGKAHGYRAAANAALAAGLLWTSARLADGHDPASLDAVTGLFMGFSMSMNLMLVRRGRRSGGAPQSL